MSTDQPPKPNRRWYQFSLKTLLIVVTVATLSFGGWVQYRRHQARVNRERVAAIEEAVAAIEELGGEVTYQQQAQRPRTWLEDQFDDPGDADDPVRRLGVARLQLDTNLNNTIVEHLAKLTNLISIDLHGAQVTDISMEHLKSLTSLDDLDLSSTNISDAGLEHCKRLTDIKTINLWNTKVTDTGLKHLRGLSDLWWLNLGGTEVTDDGLKHLRGLSDLDTLSLEDTHGGH